ncbi:MAG: hypothetical protein HRT86_07720 [Ilumatobacteraceae bacterium]|nr:hypothetical protein [Ilumatobacteraceae bacterium]
MIDDAPIPPAGYFERRYAPLLELPTVQPVILRPTAMLSVSAQARAPLPDV